MKKSLLVLFLLLVSWREFLFLLTWNADSFLPYDPSFPYIDLVLKLSNTPRWMYSWANFDGIHYLTITNIGYWGIGLVQAFFPLYPLTVGFIAKFFHIWPVTSGVGISFFCMSVFLLVWFKELSLKYKDDLIWRTLLIVLLFPTSFFFAALYSESFFLMWFVLTWYFVRQRNWLLVALAIMAASATRLIGIVLIPAVILNLWVEHYGTLPHRYFISIKPLLKSFFILFEKDWKKIFVVSLGSFGLVSFMYFLHVHYQDALTFFHVQDEFGAGRETKLITLPQVFWRSFRILQTVQRDDWKYFAYVQETVVSFLFLALWGIGAIKRHVYQISWGELLFSAAAYLLPTSTGTFSSMPRYVLVCLPLFVVLAHVLKKKTHFIIWIILSSFLLMINTLLFIQGYWVA